VCGDQRTSRGTPVQGVTKNMGCEKTQKDMRHRSTHAKARGLERARVRTKTYPQGRGPCARAADASDPYVDATAPAITARRPEQIETRTISQQLWWGGGDLAPRRLGPSPSSETRRKKKADRRSEDLPHRPRGLGFASASDGSDESQGRL